MKRSFIAYKHDGTTVIDVDTEGVGVDDFSVEEFRWITETYTADTGSMYTNHWAPAKARGQWTRRSQVIETKEDKQ